jgi:hypothetical protein
MKQSATRDILLHEHLYDVVWNVFGLEPPSYLRGGPGLRVLGAGLTRVIVIGPGKMVVRGDRGRGGVDFIYCVHS